MKKNKGYTLVELMIVLAIMAVLTAVSLVTLGVMNQAKYNASINSFQTQLSNLWVQTKAVSQSKKQDKPSVTTDEATYPLCMVVTLNEDDTDDIRNGSYVMTTGYNTDADVNEKEQLSTITHLVKIKYIPTNSKQLHGKTKLDGSGYVVGDVVIQYNKADGSVTYGAGEYQFYYNDSVVGTVYLDAVTGKHYIK